MGLYFEPNSDISFYQYFLHFIEIRCTIGSTVLLVGDINLPSITSKSFDLAQSTNKCQSLFHFMLYHEMESHNNVTNSLGRTLDLVSSNLPNMTVVRELHPLVKEDAYHPSFCISFSRVRSPKLRNKRNILGFNSQKGNCVYFYNELARVEWQN